MGALEALVATLARGQGLGRERLLAVRADDLRPFPVPCLGHAARIATGCSVYGSVCEPPAPHRARLRRRRGGADRLEARHRPRDRQPRSRLRGRSLGNRPRGGSPDVLRGGRRDPACRPEPPVRPRQGGAPRSACRGVDPHRGVARDRRDRSRPARRGRARGRRHVVGAARRGDRDRRRRGPRARSRSGLGGATRARRSSRARSTSSPISAARSRC